MRAFLRGSATVVVFWMLWRLPILSGQPVTGTLVGTVRDASGAVIAGSSVTVTNQNTGIAVQLTTGIQGTYLVPYLPPGSYDITAEARGFRTAVSVGHSLTVNAIKRVDFTLQPGEMVLTLEVTSDAVLLNFETAERQDGIAPQTLQELPLLVSGNPRSSGSFAILMPGVTTGGQANPFDARINGGVQSGDEAILDGVSLQQGLMSQSGLVSIFQDFPLSPDMVSEVKVLSSNYEPQYGSTTSAQIIATTRSGTSDCHGGVYEYHRNTVLNARQFGADQRPKDIEHDLGGFFGGPAKLGPLSSPENRTYFYVNFEAFRNAGGVNRPTLSIPSRRQRQGDFRDWMDAGGTLIPIFDPATTRPNPAFKINEPVGPANLPYLRDQFMGCDGRTPNVICPTRIRDSLANRWFRFLPDPSSDQPLNNYLVPTPLPDGILGRTNYWLVRIDHYRGQKDSFHFSMWYQGGAPQYNSALPRPLANELFSAPQYSFVNRFNWTHTFSSTLLNHFSAGYLNRNEGYGSVNAAFVDQFPQIQGVASHHAPPVITFSDDFAEFGNAAGINTGNVTTRPSYVANNLLTWVTGKHTFKFGGEYRNLGMNIHSNWNEAGTFHFDRLTTGLIGLNSGSPIASFLLEAVSSASVTFRAIGSSYPRADAWISHFGDTFRLAPWLSVNYGVRWDLFRPSTEKFDRLSFFDPLGVNPSAGHRRGRLAFAGTSWGEASFGARHPEETFKRGVAPRLGLALSLGANSVLRTGYGIFFSQAFYPGWNGGIGQDGFTSSVSLSSKLGGMEPALLLNQGLPHDIPRPPIMDAGFRNGQSVFYRPFDANRLAYSQQWNLTLEHQFGNSWIVSTAYVGNKGTRLPSTLAPLNALDPRFLSLGPRLFDEFQAGDVELHGVPVPYTGWREQMTGCSPSLAQALLPFPQYCGPIQGLNENAGNSTYHSFQMKAERRVADGAFVLASYTLSKLLTTSDNTQREALTWSGAHGVISPFERHRNKALAVDDVPQTFSLAFVYDLPVGSGQRWTGPGGLGGKLVRGWSVSSTFRASSGIPFFFRSGTCTVPEQFRAACIPAMAPDREAFAQPKDRFDPARPLFNREDFQPLDSFNFDYGSGPRISNLRGFAYHNQDLAVFKDTALTESVTLQLRAEFFNLWNWHIFNSSGAWGSSAFDTDLASPTFGLWNGTVTRPRNIQVGARITF
ncbi:MAG: carboxypeptidase-like regulatory domain-containing protein [Acidobacteriota bacterium]